VGALFIFCHEKVTAMKHETINKHEKLKAFIAIVKVFTI
jgi:hypothetical protein